MLAGDVPLSDFTVGASFVGAEVVLTLGGEVDALTAPEFGAFFQTMIDRGHHSVVLDLADLRFMDASGLAVIAHGAGRLRASGGSLSIRSPVVLIRKMLELTGFSELVLDRERESEPEQAVRPVPSGVVEEMRKFTAIYSDSEFIDGALRLAISLARSVVGGADGVSVSLRRRGRLSTVAATDETISNMDASQYETGEGPCVDASIKGHWFHAASLDSETRWPSFTPRARSLGIEAILSSPLLVQDRPVGALNIYSRTPAAFTSSDQEMAALFAAETSLALRGVETEMDYDQLSVRFQSALRTREVIAHARGVLMEREGLAEREAFTALRRSSLEEGSPLHERAAEIVMSARRSAPGQVATVPDDVGDYGDDA
jgi:anti-anti-sigma factor